MVQDSDDDDVAHVAQDQQSEQDEQNADRADDRDEHGKEEDPPRRREARLPAAVATLAAILLYAALPNELLLGPRILLPVLETGLLIALVAANPRHLTRENRLLRSLSVGLAVLIVLGNLGALVFLVGALVTGEAQEGKTLLLAAAQVWATNVIAYALLFWEMDRGGPVRRQVARRGDLLDADFRFPQDEDHDTVTEVARRSSIQGNWVPAFVDYLYVSCTNSSAFSPTDTMPLSGRAKLLMMAESTSALLISVLVIARAVGALQPS
jgi:hypothetical protein